MKACDTILFIWHRAGIIKSIFKKLFIIEIAQIIFVHTTLKTEVLFYRRLYAILKIVSDVYKLKPWAAKNHRNIFLNCKRRLLKIRNCFVDTHIFRKCMLFFQKIRSRFSQKNYHSSKGFLMSTEQFANLALL